MDHRTGYGRFHHFPNVGQQGCPLILAQSSIVIRRADSRTPYAFDCRRLGASRSLNPLQPSDEIVVRTGIEPDFENDRLIAAVHAALFRGQPGPTSIFGANKGSSANDGLEAPKAGIQSHYDMGASKRPPAVARQASRIGNDGLRKKNTGRIAAG